MFGETFYSKWKSLRIIIKKKNYSQSLVPLEGMSDLVSRDEAEAGGSENFKPLLEAGDQPC